MQTFIHSVHTFILLLLLLAGPVAFAQTKQIKGRVTDSDSGDPIPFVNVFFKGGTVGTTTDFDGYYTLKVPVGTLSDSLTASNISYTPRSKVINKSLAEQTINFQLEASSYKLAEVVISSGENPAFPIMREVVKNKAKNNKRSLNAYQYESYTKVEIDVDNISDKLRKKKAMQKIISVIDSLDQIAGEDGKPILPMFISEAISNYYYRDNPKKIKENIIKTKITGIGITDGSLVSQLVGSSFQEYNFYDNWLRIVQKDFASPIGDGWKGNYEFFLADTVELGDFPCYRIEIEPKRKQDLAFTGTIWIDSKSYALKQIDVTIGKEANLNFIEKIKLQQELEPTVGTGWLPVKTRVLIDIAEISNSSAGMLAKFYISNRDFVVNEPKDLKFYDMPIEVEEDARMDVKNYWEQNRHDSLSNEEKSVLVMIDSIKNIPVVKTYVEIANIVVNGYKKFGPIDVGPYLYTYLYNNIEGHRFRAGLRTNVDFSRKWVFKGYGAYGTHDGKFKYGTEINYIASRKPWTIFGIKRTHDIEQVGLLTEDITNTLFLAFTRFGTLRRPYFQTENTAFVQSEIKKGFTQTLRFRHFSFDPIGDFNFKYYDYSGDAPTEVNSYTSSEVTIESRFARDELFIQNDNERVSLGADKWPILTLRYTVGIKGALGSDFSYQKFAFNLNQNIKTGVLGRFNYSLTAGYIPSTLPYTLLQSHLGNESFFYNGSSFNLMNYFEFVSDTYASLKVRQNFEGLFFNRIPLIKRLKWRFLATGSILYGSVRDENLYNDKINPPVFGSLSKKPYVELGYGIDNIFRFIRIDAIHRLSYLNNPNVSRFGVKVSASFNL